MERRVFRYQSGGLLLIMLYIGFMSLIATIGGGIAYARHHIPLNLLFLMAGLLGIFTDACLFVVWMNPRIEIVGHEIKQFDWFGRVRTKGSILRVGYIVESQLDRGIAEVRVRLESDEIIFQSTISGYDELRDILANPQDWLAP